MADWDKLGKVGDAAPLKENKDNAGKSSKPKLLSAVPVSYFDGHDALKNRGGTGLSFSAYILEAVREKLERDGAL
ncbi:hypothetical protein [Enterovibrio norvegicus]|uniref:hypothetical protein n=1 Tax=Enterovibrio norvegicus TaxID=188144 RepID=UPI000C8180B9|nr:hypothetical protein [Enterovibrio norvegicus]PMN73131.1 hypothetical protein BCT27_12360 [Enterovibrio norvegicus]